MSFTIDDLLDMAEDLLGLLPDGKKRTILYDLGKLAEETGEVAECLVKSSKTKQDLAHELADVIFVCGAIAIKADIDLNKAVGEKQSLRIDKILKKFHEGKVPEGFRFRAPV